jgi:DNA replication protein DnaC
LARRWWHFGNESARIKDVMLNGGTRRIIMNTTWETFASCSWISSKHNLFLVGPGGAGETFVASALCHEAFCQGYMAIYTEVAEISKDIECKNSKCMQKLLRQLESADLLVLDEFNVSAMTCEQQYLLCNLVDLRAKKGSTVFLTRFPLHELGNCSPQLVTRLDLLFAQSYWMEFQNCGCPCRVKR